MLSRISQVAITVTDLDRAVAFYRDAMGLSVLFATNGMAFFDCGGVRLLVGTENRTAHKTILYFATDDLEADFRALISRGAKPDEPPHTVGRHDGREIWLASFEDPSGTLHHLIEERSIASGAEPRLSA